MSKDYEQLFSYLQLSEPPAGLFNKIIARLIKEDRLLIFKKRLVLYSATILASLGAFIPAIYAFRAEFTQSDFSQFLSLIFSDLGAVRANWQDFGLALLESLPAMSLTMLLASLFLLLWLFKNLAQTKQSINN